MVRTRTGLAYPPQKPWSNEMTLPQPIIHYCIKNGIPKTFSKLMRTCNYLRLKFEHLRITPLRLLFHNDNQRWKASLSGFDQAKPINLKCLYKYWLCGEVNLVSNKATTLIESVIPRIYRCEILHLRLRNQILTFDEYKILTLSDTIEIFHASHTVVKSNEPSPADIPFVMILDRLRNAKTIEV